MRADTTAGTESGPEGAPTHQRARSVAATTRADAAQALAAAACAEVGAR